MQSLTVRTLLFVFLKAAGLWCFLAPASNLNAQNAAPDTIALPHRWLGMDRFGNLYLQTPDDALVKYNQEIREINRFSDATLGELTSVDLSDPLAIVLFYRQSATVVLLDRMLNPVSKIDLSSLGLNNASAVCRAGGGGVRVFDPSSVRLVLLSENDARVQSEIPLFWQVDQPVTLTKMIEQKDKIYCLAANQNLYELALAGQIWKKLPGGRHVINFQFFNGNLYIQDDHGLLIRKANQWQKLMSLKRNDHWWIADNVLLVGNGRIVKIYRKK